MSAIPLTKVDGVDTVDSRVMAQALDIEHEAYIRTIRKYQSQMEQAFGCVRFENGDIEMPNGGTRKAITNALLTEDQCYFVLTLSRNTEAVVKAKIALVKAFSAARTQLISDMSVQNAYMLKVLERQEKQLETLKTWANTIVAPTLTAHDERIEATETNINVIKGCFGESLRRMRYTVNAEV